MVRRATLTTEPSRIATAEPRMRPDSTNRPRGESRSSVPGAAGVGGSAAAAVTASPATTWDRWRRTRSRLAGTPCIRTTADPPAPFQRGPRSPNIGRVDGSGRTARLVLVADGTVLGVLPPLQIALPWWPGAHDVVAAARSRFVVEEGRADAW